MLMEYSYNKRDLKRSVQLNLAKFDPDLRSKLTNKIMADGFIFIDGFMVCLNFFIEEPVSLKDIDDLVLSELLTFLRKRLKDV